MGYTPEDAEREAGEDRMIAQVLEDHRDVIVAEFIEERLASYFEAHPDLSRTATNALDEARRLFVLSSAAALVFALSAVEIVIQDVLLKPVVVGLTHYPELGDLLAALVDIRNKQTENMLFGILDATGMPSLRKQTLPGGKIVWDEKIELQKLRNRVIHHGDSVSKEHAARALELADYFLNTIFPEMREHFTQRTTGWV
jgi:hypothetical protein